MGIEVNKSREASDKGWTITGGNQIVWKGRREERGEKKRKRAEQKNIDHAA